jgi:hypothetical protein
MVDFASFFGIQSNKIPTSTAIQQEKSTPIQKP